MKNLSKKILIAGAAMTLLAACAKPTTQAPKYDQKAVQQETAVQKKLAEGKSAVDTRPVSKAELKSMTSRLNKHAVRIRKAGIAMCGKMGKNPKACVYDFKIKNEKNLNAYADGKSIFVTPTMMRFAKNDNALGIVLAHEYAHNMMGHIASKKQNMTIGMIAGLGLDMLAQSQGMNTKGQFSKLGSGVAGRAFSPEFESEADYVGMYVMNHAGYNTSQAAQLWRNMTIADSKGAFLDGTHPSNPKRYVTLEQTRSEIKAKKAQKMPVVPNTQPADAKGSWF